MGIKLRIAVLLGAGRVQSGRINRSFASIGHLVVLTFFQT